MSVRCKADVSLANANDINSNADALAGLEVYNPTNQIVSPIKNDFDQTPVPSEFRAAAGDNFCFQRVCEGSADFSGTLRYRLTPGVLYIITVFADSFAEDQNGGYYLTGPTGQSADASVDPHFYLDLGGSDYQLDLSLNVSNDPPSVGAVPEPSTWAMMLIGFAGLGYLGFRQRGDRRFFR